jgi:hypothetical protein
MVWSVTRGAGRFDGVIVVENKGDRMLAGQNCKLVDHCCRHGVKRRIQSAKELVYLVRDARMWLVQGRTDIAPEPRGVVVAGIERQPRGRVAAAPGPVTKQSRLAEPGRGADQCESTLDCASQTRQ